MNPSAFAFVFFVLLFWATTVEMSFLIFVESFLVIGEADLWRDSADVFARYWSFLIAGDEFGIWVVFKRIVLGFFNLLFLN